MVTVPNEGTTEFAVAVVGSGPAGFYSTIALLALAEPRVRIDMYERLPTPWGLVRAGVAPDHPKIKSISALFSRTATHERFRFFGHIEVGTHVTRAELQERYDAVVYCVGAPADRDLGIPGEDLPGVVAANDFVGWYNGHPDYTDREFDLQVRQAVVVGNGNVAIDVARILLAPADRLASTDISDHALGALRASQIDEVTIIGRRGPAQATFTTPELREFVDLTGAAFLVDPTDVDGIDESELAHVPRHNLEVLRQYARTSSPNGSRRARLRFWTSPIEIRGDGHVESVVMGRNVLGSDGRAVDTGEREVVPAGLVLRAVGYRGIPVPGLPFDATAHVVPNHDGRVVGGDREYVAGWIKRGPTGIIGSNKKDATDTVHTLAADLNDHPKVSRATDPDVVEAWLRARQPHLVDLTGWSAIDAAERAAGERLGRPRVKLCTWDELRAAAQAVRA